MWCLEILHLLFPHLLDAHIRGRTNMGDYSQFNQAVTDPKKKLCVCILETEISWVG